MVIQCKNLISLYILPDQRRGNVLVLYKLDNKSLQVSTTTQLLQLHAQNAKGYR